MRSSTVILALACALGFPVAAIASGAKPSPPVIKENFTPLPCPGAENATTTLQMQGCAQREILRTDRLINARVKTVFFLLGSGAARTRFVRAQRAWLAYRRTDCLSVADVHEGGSLATVDFANCVVERNLQRVKELKAFERALRSP